MATTKNTVDPNTNKCQGGLCLICTASDHKQLML